MVSQAIERFGRVDSLVNNAGIFIAKPFTEYTDEDYARMLGTNLNGFFTSRSARSKGMLKQGAGHIVQITTSLGRSRQQQRTIGARVADQGWIERGNQVAGDRICKEGGSRQCGVARRDQDADA